MTTRLQARGDELRDRAQREHTYAAMCREEAGRGYPDAKRDKWMRLSHAADRRGDRLLAKERAVRTKIGARGRG